MREPALRKGRAQSGCEIVCGQRGWTATTPVRLQNVAINL